jgi:C4-dicarboxylate-specific signal transduction histidine kinase
MEPRRIIERIEESPSLPSGPGDRFAGYAVIGLPRERLLEIECRLEHGDTLAISVRDSGKGIAEEDMDRVFDASHTTKPGALGMGLAISRSIVEGHGGRLWLSRNEGMAWRSI